MTERRDFLRLQDLSLADARAIFELTRTLKHEPKGRRTQLLRGRSVAIVLEKASTRTRVSFEVGIAQLGGQPVVLGVQGSQLGRGEPLMDTARVLSRYCDAIVFRTAATTRLEEMTKFASCPVINALSDDGHPVQVLCDVFTVEEASGRPIAGKTVAFVGDCSSNMARSWVEAAMLFDFSLVLAGPEDFMPPKDELARAGSRVTLRHDPKTALAGVEIVNTDVWASMGQEDAAEARVNALAAWTVDDAMLAKSDASSIVLHCLPAHRGEEISASVLEGARSRVWDQAENRLHVQKGLLLWLLGIKLD